MTLEEKLEAAKEAEAKAVSNMQNCIMVHSTAVDKSAAEEYIRGQLDLVKEAREAREDVEKELEKSKK